MANFQIGAISYQSKLMDGETQTLVLKRMLPAFTALIGCTPALKDVAAPKAAMDNADTAAEPDVEDAGNRVQDMLMPVARELAALKDADVQYIINACLAVTARQASGGGIGWVGVMQRGQVQDHNDAKFITRLTIAWHVLGENFGEMLASFGLDVADLVKVAPRAGLPV